MQKVTNLRFKDGDDDFCEPIGLGMNIKVVSNGFIIETLTEDGIVEEVAKDRLELFALLEENLNG